MLAGLFVFQAEDGIRDLVRSRGLGDVYKRQLVECPIALLRGVGRGGGVTELAPAWSSVLVLLAVCLLYTSDAADERSSVDLGGRRII